MYYEECTVKFECDAQKSKLIHFCCAVYLIEGIKLNNNLWVKNLFSL